MPLGSKGDRHPQEYTPSQVLFLGVGALLCAALINLLPWFLALRGTPGGQVREVQERKQGRIHELEREIVRIKAGKRYTRGTGGGPGKPSKGYERVPVSGERRQFLITKLRGQIGAVKREMSSAAFQRRLADVRVETASRYRLIYWLHWPSAVLLRCARKGIDFTDERIIDSAGARLVTGFLVLVTWMPVALVCGVLLALLRWRRRAHHELQPCRAEGALVVRTFLLLEVAWLVFYVAVYTLATASDSAGDGVIGVGLMVALPFVKLVQLYLVVRGCLALRVPPRRLLLLGALSGAVLLHWLALLMIFEEFGHVRELIAARHATAKDRADRAQVLRERAVERAGAEEARGEGDD